MKEDFAKFLPTKLRKLENPQTDLPRIAKDPKLAAEIESLLPERWRRTDGDW